MATKSGQHEPGKAALAEELIEALDAALDRVRILYEQYFLGIQKQPPTYLHTDIERKIREIAKLAVRNTALRYRFAMLQQKFGSYNTYWHRTLRQIEGGTYLRNLSRIGRQAARTGAVVPEEILAAMPKRMREQVKRDREAVLALAELRHRAPGDRELVTLVDEEVDIVDTIDIGVLDAPSVVRPSAELRHDPLTAGGAPRTYNIDASDADFDLDAYFAEITSEGEPSPPVSLGQAASARPMAPPTPPAGQPSAERPRAGHLNIRPLNTGQATVRLWGPSAGQPNGGQPNSGQPNSGQPNSGQPNSGQPNARRTTVPLWSVSAVPPGTGQPNSGQPNSGQPNSGQPNSGQPNSGQPNARRPTVPLWSVSAVPPGTESSSDGPPGSVAGQPGAEPPGAEPPSAGEPIIEQMLEGQVTARMWIPAAGRPGTGQPGAGAGQPPAPPIGVRSILQPIPPKGVTPPTIKPPPPPAGPRLSGPPPSPSPSPSPIVPPDPPKPPSPAPSHATRPTPASPGAPVVRASAAVETVAGPLPRIPSLPALPDEPRGAGGARPAAAHRVASPGPERAPSGGPPPAPSAVRPPPVPDANRVAPARAVPNQALPAPAQAPSSERDERAPTLSSERPPPPRAPSPPRLPSPPRPPKP